MMGGEWCTVVVLGKKSPENYKIEGLSPEEESRVFYLSISNRQAFIRRKNVTSLYQLPWSHIGHKNIGYLFAISQGAKQIWDFSDDHMLIKEEFNIPSLRDNIITYEVVRSNNDSTFNAYPMMGATHLPIWPRGLPLSHVKSKTSFQFLLKDIEVAASPQSSIAIIQSLANEGPDVDSLYRLTLPLPVNFEREDICVAVPDKSYAPLNAKSTIFFEPAFWKLFLPTSLNEQVSEIWRGYVAQRLASHINKKVFISSPLVTKDKNKYQLDMQSEQVLQLQSEVFIRTLKGITLESSSVAECLEKIYIELYNRGFLEIEDIYLVQDWIFALKSVEYQFPKIVPNTDDLSMKMVEESKIVENCLSWPDLQLFVPIAHSHLREFQHQLIQSLLFFWPLKFLKMLVILDDEIRTNRIENYLRRNTNDFKSFDIKYNKPTSFYGASGHDRQQLIMFWADNFTDSDYVGFVDTDTFFLTAVYKSDLFEDGKPVIIAFHTTLYQQWWGEVSKTTEETLGEEEEIRCMSHFPVIVKTEHLVGLRQFVQQKHNMSFNEYFSSSIVAKPYSQFNIMCVYLWNHHRDEYAWHIQIISRKRVITKDTLAEKEKEFGASFLYPKARISFHSNHHFAKGLPLFFSEVMAKGYCSDANARRLSNKLDWCHENRVFLRNFHQHMFNFEFQSWDYHPKMKESFQLRQKMVAECPQHLWNMSTVEKLSLDLMISRGRPQGIAWRRTAGLKEEIAIPHPDEH